MKKIFSFVYIFLLFFYYGYSQVLNDSQIINPNNKIYEDLHNLQLDNQLFFFTQNTPISIAEIKLYINQLEYEKLSDYSKSLYNTILDSIKPGRNFLPCEEVQFFVNVIANVEGYYKSNDNIKWSHNYFYKDNFLTFPVGTGFGNLFSISSDLFLGKNYIATQKNENFTNIPLGINDLQFMFPNYAYGSFGKNFNKWGMNFHFGKQGKTIGDTLSGSILYNSTFETDGYAEFSLYSNWMKYTCDVVQISSNRMDTVQGDNVDRYMYIHQYDFRLFKKAKFSLFEGSLVCNPFALRYLNPLMIMHQYGGWTEYNWPLKDADGDTDGFLEGPYKFNSKKYRETNFCAYFAGMFEILPVRNLRFYGIYNQIELQTPWERNQVRGKYMPNSFGLQLGTDYNLILENDGVIEFGLEGIYTSPYMYIKQTPSSSLYRFRNDMETSEKVYSWVGTPFGPNCLAGQFKIAYKPNKKWNCEFDYVISAKGKNGFDIFDGYGKYTNKNETVSLYNYYPTLKYYLIKYNFMPGDLDDVYEDTMSLGFGIIPEIKNQFCVKGNYCFNNNFSVSGQFIYEVVLNSCNIENKTESGVECSIAITYNLF